MGKLRNSFLLFIAALIWGMAFVAQQEGMEHMGPFTFITSRSLLGFLVLIPVILFRRLRTPKEERKPIPVKATALGGICCGVALSLTMIFQQFGLTMTTVGKGGFITTLYIIFTPILGLFIKKKPPKVLWISALLAIVGMYLLCMTDSSFAVGTGDLLVLVCAVACAAQILFVDYFVEETDGVLLSCVQFFFVFAVTLVPAIVIEQPTFSQITDGAVSILYTGILSSGVAFTLQIVAQKGLDPTVAALIMSLESVVAAIAGYIAYKVGFLPTDQSMTPRQLIGCAVVFAAIIIVQIPWENLRKKAT